MNKTIFKFDRSKNLGFTIIELLVVFSIITVLSAIGVASFSSYNKNQQMTQAISSIKLLISQARSNALNGVKINNALNGAKYICQNSLSGYSLVIDTSNPNSHFIDLTQNCQGVAAATIRRYYLPKSGSSQLIRFISPAPDTQCSQISFDALSATSKGLPCSLKLTDNSSSNPNIKLLKIDINGNVKIE